VLDSAGALSWRKMGTLVLGDLVKRRQLEDIMHPWLSNAAKPCAPTAALTVVVAGFILLLRESETNETEYV